jgi:hypothetical protein
MSKKKIPKSKIRLLEECEEHLMMLNDALSKYPQQRYRYKQIAAELRVLVCKFGSHKPLLLDLMDEYGFNYEIQPTSQNPIPQIVFEDDPTHKQIGRLLSEGQFDEADKLISTIRMPLALRNYVNDGLAIYIKPNSISHHDMVRKIAEQEGSAHEDKGVDSDVAQLKRLRLGGEESHIAVLIVFAKLISLAGLSFFEYLNEKKIYEPNYLNISRNR